MRALCVVVLFMTSCNKPRPAVGLSGTHEGPRHVVGAQLRVRASWEATCTDWSAALDDLTSKHSGMASGQTEPCKQKPFELTVECSTKCLQQAERPDGGDSSVLVIPEELGPLTITATSRRSDNGATSRKVLETVLIVLPDRIELRCATGTDPDPTLACGPEGVPANRPMLRALLHIDRHTAESTALRINGKPVPGDSAGRFSLADIYPEARVGDGIQPGTYPITLAVGARTSTWQLVAR